MAREKTKTSPAPNAPDFLAWHVSQKGEKSFWNKVGAAWAHKDGQGYTLQLETCPINGRIVLRAPLDDTPPQNEEGRSESALKYPQAKVCSNSMMWIIMRNGF